MPFRAMPSIDRIGRRSHPPSVAPGYRSEARLADLLAAAHDDFRPGSAYGEWYDERSNLVRAGLGPV
jgi:hypothetical protein